MNSSLNQINSSVENGNLMGVGGGIGDDAEDVTYSTKPNNPFAQNSNMKVKVKKVTETTTIQYENEPGHVMGVGGGFGDDADDVTYSTKPNNQTTNYKY